MSRVYLTVLLTIREGMRGEFEAFEREVKPIIERYGGRFERVIRLEGKQEYDEVHWLSWDSAESLQLYLTSPEAKALAEKRERIIEKTTVYSGYEVDYL